MSKKNVVLVLLIVCIVAIMLVSVLGNNSIVHDVIYVDSVDIFDVEGHKIEVLEGAEAMSIKYDYSKDDIVEVAISEEETKQYLTVKFYIVVTPGDAYYPEVTVTLNGTDETKQLEHGEGSNDWPFEQSYLEFYPKKENNDNKKKDKDEQEDLGPIVSLVSIKIDVTGNKTGSVSIDMKIDERKNLVAIKIPSLTINYEYQKSDQEIVDDSEELE